MLEGVSDPELDVVSCDLQGKAAVPITTTVTPDMPDVVVRRVDVLLLHVVDARSEDELRSVQVRISSHETLGLLEDPMPQAGTSELFIANEPSPLVIPAEVARSCWVGGEGYAWQRVRLEGSGSHSIRLEPGGAVQVTASSPVLTGERVAALGPRQELLGAVPIPSSGAVLMDGLPVGRLHVRREGGPEFRLRGDVVIVDIRAGQVTPVSLTPIVLPDPTRAGRLLVTVLGDVGRDTLCVFRSGSGVYEIYEMVHEVRVSELESAHGLEYQGLLPLMQPGSYLVRLMPTGSEQMVELRAGQIESVLLEGADSTRGATAATPESGPS